jgi:hypothetical protein
MAHINGASLPGVRTRERRWRWLYWVRRGCTLQALCLSEKLQQRFIHWLTDGSERSKGCTADSGECGYCKQGIPRRWAAYVAALLEPTREPCVIMVTEFAARQLQADPVAATGLRGKVLTLQRSKGSKWEEVYATLSPPRPQDILVPAFDVQPTLDKVWSGDGKVGQRVTARKVELSIIDGAELPELPAGGRDDCPF